MLATKNRKEQVIQTNHGASHPKLSNLLLKFGLTWMLLPYVGEWKEWHLVMNLACTQTRKVWKDSLKGYQGLNKSVKWRPHKAEIEELFRVKFNSNIQINDQTNLFLIASCSSDIGFISSSRELRFPKMNKLELWKADHLPFYTVKNMSKFFKNCSQNKINEFVMSSEMIMDLSYFNESLTHIISNTLRVIKLERFSINQETLQTIFSSLKDVNELRLNNWWVDIKQDFKIEASKWADLKILDFKRTWKQDSNTHLNSNKLRILINALSLTPVRQSLKVFQCNDQEFAHKDCKRLLREFDFKWEIW